MITICEHQQVMYSALFLLSWTEKQEQYTVNVEVLALLNYQVLTKYSQQMYFCDTAEAQSDTYNWSDNYKEISTVVIMSRRLSSLLRFHVISLKQITWKPLWKVVAI